MSFMCNTCSSPVHVEHIFGMSKVTYGRAMKRTKSKIAQKRLREVLLKLENCQREITRCQEILLLLHEEADAILSKSEVYLPEASGKLSKTAHDLSDVSNSGGLVRAPGPNASSIDLYNPNRGRGTPHPGDAPSIWDMVYQILSEVRTKRPEGLTGREIVEEVNKRWWPGVSQNTVLSKLYKFEKNRRTIQRTQNRWHLPRQSGRHRN